MNVDGSLDQLTNAARAVISAGFWTSPTSALRRATKETEFVATLIASCVGPLVNAWSHILAEEALSVTVQGVFLHQRPKIRFPSTSATPVGPGFCELADLLIVHDHGGHRQACLIQAKKVPGAPVVGDQKDLYERWDPFRFASGGQHVKGRLYDVAPNREGGFFGVVRVPPPGLEEPWLVEHPIHSVASTDMGRFVAEMHAGTIAGRTNPARPAVIGGTDDWSVLIDDLLRMSLGSTYPLVNFWPRRMPRHLEGLVSYMPLANGWHAIASSDPDIPRGRGGFDVEEPREGMPTIYVQTAPVDGDRKDGADDLAAD